MSYSAKLEITVRWADCDKAGIVFFPHYFSWFDTAAWNYFEQGGMAFQDIIVEHDIFGMPIVNASCQFLAPAKERDLLIIESEVVKWGNRSFEFRHRVFNGETLGAEGHIVHIWGARDANDRDKLRAGEIPRNIIAHFENLPGT